MYSTVSKYLKVLVLAVASMFVIGCGGGGGEDGSEGASTSASQGNAASNNSSAGQAAVANSSEISLGWDTPTEREDDSALELYEIDGYVIAYGDAPDALETTYTITGGQVTSHTFESVDQGTYYFAIATVDSDGSQGAYSDPVEVVVN